jgi:radical SAM family uncharacterized protein/radical SAM-linked protein
LADFFDSFLIGDGEEAVLDICKKLIICKQDGLNKAETLRVLAKIPGIYIPSFYTITYDEFGEFQKITTNNSDVPAIIKKRILPELQNQNYPLNPLVPLIEITHDRLAVEIMRGCTEGCRFCNAGMIYRPVRQRPVDDIVRMTQQAIESSGFNEVSLLSLNTSDYKDLSWLMTKEKILLAQERVNFTFPSLRLDGLTPEMVDFVQMFKKSGFTFAPEAGSQRLRNVINKNIREQDILDTMQLVLENGWQLVKFYFMVGLPTEKEEDLYAIVELVEKCRKLAQNFKNVRINVALSPFSPKPHTPFQWEKQENPLELERKCRLIRSQLQNDKVNVSWRDGYVSSLESIFTRGGRELSEVLEEAWKNGARFDGWNEGFDWEKWKEAFQKFNLDWQKYLRPLSVSVPLPWDHINMGISKTFLQKEKFRGYDGKLSQDCKDYVCLGCGLQRADFNKLVDCFKIDESLAKKSVTSQHVSDGQQAQPVMSFGRSVKKRPTTSQVAKKKIRVRYSKTGLTRFISHLDVIRLLDRAARRAKISLVYSQGFKPRPRFSFGPPLALGVASIAEYVDIEAEIGREADIQNNLNGMLPTGIRILAQKTVFTKVPSLASVINRVTYETFLNGTDFSDNWIQDWLSQDEILVQRVVKEQEKVLNVKPFIQEIKVGQGKLHISLNAIEGRMAKITEVLESLLSGQEIDYRQYLTQRIGQYIVDGENILEPFDVI